jgi:phospholipase C
MPDIAKLKTLIDTVVIVMFENRSFDHVLGHLSLDGSEYAASVEGLRKPLKARRYENVCDAQLYYPYGADDKPLPVDLPHERADVAMQMRPSGRLYSMGGFVKAYFASQDLSRPRNPEAMWYLKLGGAPVTSFLARQFAVCDHWFCPIPTSTRPNKLMALTGDSRVDSTGGGISFPPYDNLVIDWLEARHVRWRVYHDGLSFFLILKRFADVLTGPNFRDFDRLIEDVETEPSAEFPQVIIVEPSYSMGTALSPHPNDNHAPLSMAPGEEFLLRVYESLTSNKARWARTALILMYDEHGGFFDHVPPPKIAYSPPNGEYPGFESAGPRVPAVIICPLVSAGSVCKQTMDHTSVLQFLAELHGRSGESYSSTVLGRARLGVKSVSEVFNLVAPRDDSAPMPAVKDLNQVSSGSHKVSAPPLQAAFEAAAAEMLKTFPDDAVRRFPGLRHWQLRGGAAQP